MTLPAQHATTGTSREIATFLHEVNRFLDPRTINVALDIGSRDAEVAVALRRSFPNSRVYAFECNPPALQLCRDRLSAFGDDRIFLVAKAVSDSTGQLDFYSIDPTKTMTPHADGNIGASSLFVANPDYPFERYSQIRVTVDSTTIADWARGAHVTSIDIIWMDLQGGELRALKGMGDLLKTVKVVYTEVEFKPVYVGQPLFVDVDQFMRSMGFRLHKILNRSDWAGDAMYVRRGRLTMPLNWILRKVGSLLAKAMGSTFILAGRVFTEIGTELKTEPLELKSEPFWSIG